MSIKRTTSLFPRNRVGFIKSRLPKLSGRSVEPPPREPRAYAMTPEHKVWAREVLRRAGYECEKCGAQDVRLFADHIIEVKDGGSKLSLSNGQALCGSCHTKKTIEEKKKRFGLD